MSFVRLNHDNLILRVFTVTLLRCTTTGNVLQRRHPDQSLQTAIEGTYIDKKCPFTGNVSIRGRILSGVVTKMKMQRTIVIRRDYLHYIRKYNRFEKRHKNMSVHLSPCFRDVQIGDIVTVGECRPLSKTVRFNVLKVTKAAGTKKQFQKF
ncbi:ribosomal protein S11 [Columba livia]|uniref:Small ribosomal subunit protein uS17 n=1 Tax=Columba livia TaxID=8932 RepID=A0A2I0LPM8_COLLI|nr:ribosomal protein S11 [Columba livia]